MSTRKTTIVLRRFVTQPGRRAICGVPGCPRRAEFTRLYLSETGKPLDAQLYCGIHGRVLFPEAAGAIDDGADEAEIDS